jgi:hypothetical protein
MAPVTRSERLGSYYQDPIRHGVAAQS